MPGTPPDKPPAPAPPPSRRAGLPSWLFTIAAFLGAWWLIGRGFGLAGAVLLAMILPLLVHLVVLLCVFVPLRVRRTSWFSSTPEVRPFDLEAPGTPPSVAEGSRATAEALAPLGFVVRGTYRVAGQNHAADSYVCLLEDRASRTVARRLDVFLRSGTPVEAMLSFSTRFADGTEVATSNMVRPPLAPMPKSRQGFPFPEVRDPARLLALHRRAVAEGGEFSARISPIEGDPAGFLLRSIAEEQAYLARAGYYRLEESSGLYRLTRRGAFLMTWKQIWPWGRLRRYARFRRARRLLRRWEGSPG